MVTSRIRPSASCPTADRACRKSSCSVLKASFARKIGFPLRTRSGPPPSPSFTPAQLGLRTRRSVTVWPAWAGALPGRDELDPVDVQSSRRVDADARAARDRLMHECAVPEQDSGRVAVGTAEVVAVDACDGGGGRDSPLDRDQLLGSKNR